MLIRKKEVHCEKCQARILYVPLYMSNFHISVEKDWNEHREETLRGDLQWNCPMCNYTNREIIHLFLNEDDYISIIVNKFTDYSREEVEYK